MPTENMSLGARGTKGTYRYTHVRDKVGKRVAHSKDSQTNNSVGEAKDEAKGLYTS